MFLILRVPRSTEIAFLGSFTQEKGEEWQIFQQVNKLLVTIVTYIFFWSPDSKQTQANANAHLVVLGGKHMQSPALSSMKTRMPVHANKGICLLTHAPSDFLPRHHSFSPFLFPPHCLHLVHKPVVSARGIRKAHHTILL